MKQSFKQNIKLSSSNSKGMTQRFNVLLITFPYTPTIDHHFLVRFYIVTGGRGGGRVMAMLDAIENEQYFKFSNPSNQFKTSYQM